MAMGEGRGFSMLCKMRFLWTLYAIQIASAYREQILELNSKIGDYGQAVQVWVFSESTQELLLQRRGDSKDLWPGLWDVSSAGYVSAGDKSLLTARKQLNKELGLDLPEDAFELIFEFLPDGVTSDGKSDVYNVVYLVTTLAPIPMKAFDLKGKEVSAVRYVPYMEYKSLLANKTQEYVPYDVAGQYGQLFNIIETRYKEDKKERSLSLQKQLDRYASVSFDSEVTGLSQGDMDALVYIIKAARVLDDVFYEQVWYNNPTLRDWLKEHSDDSDLDKLKWAYYHINKAPWSSLDENKAFLTTADSAVKLLNSSRKLVSGWKGLEYRAAFPLEKPPGANFYPPDMDKEEFESWKSSLSEDQQKAAVGFFSVIRRRSDTSLSIVPYSEQYGYVLKKASDLLQKAYEVANTPSLKKLLKLKAAAFLSNDYYDSDIAWMELDSKVDITIGPYETYGDALFGYKATFEAFVGVRDDLATSELKLFSEHLQEMEDNLPMDDSYKSKGVTAAPIRVIQLFYTAGDVRGPQIVAFNLPNDERIVKERGTSVVMLKNLQEAKFEKILQPISDICITEEQKQYVNFDPYFTHTICHECVHGIGPHTITLPSGEQSTVRLQLQELHSAVEEAKADIVGLWALKFLIDQGYLSKNLTVPMYVSFLAGCFRSVRFGLDEAHGKGQALIFNYILEKGGFVMDTNGAFSVDFSKVEGAVESLSREILTIQAQGDKPAAASLLDKYGQLAQPLSQALDKLEKIQVPVDIAPKFEYAEKILNE
ncbi:nudix hydrolase 3 isoform X1 [Amborella trichopoda]|uniref:Nudix hydrolase domain-containing protein n=1 Tax=Amborella trichopoda TaxID=13333 RepID=W1PJ01_AMBTC|nr:nudix hydrolase 3 isoform X1 [Amborella trichopoda]ERN07090.1 hypothetical protein AMTR_s00019p00081500 [Amborella trichopoda]|eukprot:XP_020523790.1 nudix hydrolase 3 isoform X1 [Amborella trichopoda]